MTKARVLRIIARMNVGGPAQQISGLLQGLDTDRFDHRLVVGTPDAGEEDWVALRAPWIAHDPRVVTVPSLTRPIDPRNDIRAYRELRGQIRDFEPDIVHTHTGKAGLVGRLAAHHEAVPHLVHTYHGHTLSGYFGAATSSAMRGAERYLARRTDFLLAVGAQVRNDLLQARIGRDDQFIVVPPGVTTPQRGSRAESRAQLGVGNDVPVVTYVGRLAHIKRPDRAIAVAERVAQDRPDTVFLIVGGADDGLIDRLRRSIGIADVRFLGWVADVSQIYAASDIMLLTSDSEGMPVSLIEAGMCGVPSVATNVGSVSEVVLDNKTGRVVVPTTEALAEAVLELISRPTLRESLGKAAQLHTMRNFSMERLVESTESVYEKLLSLHDPEPK